MQNKKNQQPPFRNERAFQNWVVKEAKKNGWLVYFTENSKGSPRGFPDLVLVKEDYVIFAELKIGTNDPSESQKKWLHRLKMTQETRTFLWYPSDCDSIEKLLSRTDLNRVSFIMQIFSGKE